MQTLYQRIGGRPAIKNLITTFYQKVFSDPKLGPFFLHTSLDKLTRMQEEFFSIALGGPESLTDISLFEAHQNRGIKRDHLTLFTDHLLTTLLEVGIDDVDANDVVAHIATYADEILGDSSVDG